MLYYDRTDIIERIYPTKSNISKEYLICHYCFLNHGFEFQDYSCNHFYDLTVLCLNISDIAVIIVKNADYSRIIHNITKFEAINLLKYYVVENRGYIKKILS